MGYKTRECSIEDLQPEVASAIRQHISGNDKILFCYETRHGVGLGSQLTDLLFFDFSPSSEAQVITQNQVIHANKWAKREANSSIRLVDISSISETKSSDGYCRIIIRSRGGGEDVHAGFASEQVARKFANTLREVIKQAESVFSTTPTQSPGTPKERLRALAQLHKEGLLSDLEFQQKRQEILSQL